MANINAPFGLRPIRRVDGAALSGAFTRLKIANADTNALNRGDVVQQLSTGYVTVGAAGITTHAMRGVFIGCHYLASALGYPIWSNYWPGAGAVGDVDAFVIDDPFIIYEAMAAGAAPITLANVGLNIDVVVNASTTGLSKWAVNQATIAATATFPFRIVALGNNLTNIENGYDATSANNIVELAWNDHFLTQKTGI